MIWLFQPRLYLYSCVPVIISRLSDVGLLSLTISNNVLVSYIWVSVPLYTWAGCSLLGPNQMSRSCYLYNERNKTRRVYTTHFINLTSTYTETVTSTSNLLQTDHKEHIGVLPNEITVSTEQRTKEKEKNYSWLSVFTSLMTKKPIVLPLGKLYPCIGTPMILRKPWKVKG